MNKKVLVSLGVIVVAIIVGYSFIQKNMPVSSAAQKAATATITNVGQKMKMVSLLAPAETLNASMDEHYAPYVAPALLSLWKANPTQAPGRTVSSPWPDRIEVTRVTKSDNSSYTVVGNVIEVTSEESGAETAATYAVAATVEKVNGTWLITEFEKGTYAGEAALLSVNGKYTCLPHKDTSGPQTMECALGIQIDSGEYYALDTSAVQNSPVLNTGWDSWIKVTGTFVPAETLSSDRWQKYTMVGIIRVTSLAKL
jgi:hypothetical protein